MWGRPARFSRPNTSFRFERLAPDMQQGAHSGNRRSDQRQPNQTDDCASNSHSCRANRGRLPICRLLTACSLPDDELVHIIIMH